MLMFQGFFGDVQTTAGLKLYFLVTFLLNVLLRHLDNRQNNKACFDLRMMT